MTSTPAASANPSRARVWLIAAMLTLPWLLPLASHLLLARSRGLHATGFIQGDMPYYMANAREAFDAGESFRPWYGNPFTYHYDTPRIYFQPLTFILGLAGWISSIDPGLLLAVTQLIGALVCGVVAISLFEHFVTDGSRQARALGVVSLFWGGGLLCLTGLVLSLWQNGDARAMLALDPGDGWWFQNFGRNLVYAPETVYHALFLGAILAVLRRRFIAATIFAALMSASHPFTGIQLLAILGAWAMLERAVLHDREVPLWFVVACAALAIAHVLYYLVFLPSFPEHRQVFEQWKRPWVLQAGSLIPAYLIVAALVAARLRVEPLRQLWANRGLRLLLVWAAVSLVLAEHDLIMPPIQPLHFTRGYIWIPLFLLGAPVLVTWFDRWVGAGPGRGHVLAVALVMLVIVSDNVLWLVDHVTDEALTAPHRFGSPGFMLTDDERAALRWLNRRENSGFVVISEDPTIGYLTTVYTALRSWKSHQWNTPETNEREQELRRFFGSGVAADAWRGLPLVIVYRRSESPAIVAQALGRRIELAYRNDTYTIFRAPLPAGATGMAPFMPSVPNERRRHVREVAFHYGR